MNRVNILIYLGFILVIMLCIQQCNSVKADLKNMETNVLNYKDTVFKERDKFGNEIASNKALVLSSQDQLEQVIKANKELSGIVSRYKRITNVTVIRSEAKIDSFSVTLHDTIPCDFKPIHFDYDSSYLQMRGVVSMTSVGFFEIKIPNEQSIVVGDKKLGFLKGTEYEISVINKNPKINVLGIRSYTIKPKSAWYESKLLFYGLGVVSAILIIKL